MTISQSPMRAVAGQSISYTPNSAPYWDGLRRGVIRVQHCRTCLEAFFYPRARCLHCLGEDLEWRPVTGTPRLVTWTVAHRATSEAFEDQPPQTIAVVEIASGVQLTSTLVDTGAVRLREGLALEPVFDRSSANLTLLRFRPVQRCTRRASA